MTWILLWISSPSEAKNFVHPGGWVNKTRLDFVKQQILNQSEPWTSELNNLKRSNFSKRVPQASDFIDSNDDRQATLLRDDALAAYTMALLWYYTDDASYAKKAVIVLNSWSRFQGFDSGTDQDKLLAGWTGAVFATSAEIMRLYGGWKTKDKLAFQNMFRNAYYPHLISASNWNGNVDLTQIDALISIAVFNEDIKKFNLALSRFKRRLPAYIYLASDGKRPTGINGDGGDSPTFWGSPEHWTDGINQETCRDYGHHSQFGLGSAIHVAEVAWNQGVDIYTQNEARLTTAIELLATQLLSGVVDSCNKTKASSSLFNTWEMGFNHYHNRRGLPLPNTKLLIEKKVRPDSQRAIWNLVYETLTHAGNLQN